MVVFWYICSVLVSGYLFWCLLAKTYYKDFPNERVKIPVWVWILAGIITLLFIANLIVSVIFFFVVSIDDEYGDDYYCDKEGVVRWMYIDDLTETE